MRAPGWLALAQWLAVLGIGVGGDIADRIGYPLLDWNLRLFAVGQGPDVDIVVLDIDEPSLAAMAPDFDRYPWTRAVYGELIEGLARQKPAAVVFDILLVDPQRDHTDDDLYLIRVVPHTPDVFFPMVRLPGGAAADAQGLPLIKLAGVERGVAADEGARARCCCPCLESRPPGASARSTSTRTSTRSFAATRFIARLTAGAWRRRRRGRQNNWGRYRDL